MAGAHEQLERAEHAEHARACGRRATDRAARTSIALLIAILALFLAISETLGKGAQTEGLNYNVEASNLWAFFQAKTIRQTAVRTAAETLELTRPQAADPAVAEAVAKRLDTWAKTVARWETEPETQEGRKRAGGAGKAGGDEARHLARPISSLRGRIGGVPDRDRARLGGGDHERHGARLHRDRDRRRGPRLHRHRPLAPHSVHLF